MRRRIPAVLAVIGLSALTLVGCSSSAPAAAGCEGAADDAGSLETVDVSGAPGEAELTLNAPIFTDTTVAVEETAGDGPKITSEMQDVVFSVAIADGATGQALASGAAPMNTVASWRENYSGLADMLMCATEGSRVLGAVPASALSEPAAQNWGLEKDDTIVVAMDVQRVYLAAADGAPQYNDRRGMPSVVLAPNGTPGIIVPDAAPPTDLAVEVLKKGDGPAVTDADSILIQYTGITWAERTVFDSTWEKGAPLAVTLDGVVPGFAQALEGQTVGSQVLAVIPPELGYGDQGSGSIPGDATLVFVIDILGVDPATGS
ncbi:FKBP-type peptidyl-prolyl cis-trans isomerase [Microbacterium sp.]|uniref:FKBP-type peptidyl-prolyl cis-trans isomerase n=1 Tax=Microbacterium sp. TaxID=51671 RepID=UPI003C7753F3